MERASDQSGDMDNRAPETVHPAAHPGAHAGEHGGHHHQHHEHHDGTHVAPSRLVAPPWVQRLREAHRTRFTAYRQSKLGWRLAAPVVFVAGGVLFVTSAISSEGNDLRPERYSDLADLAQSRTDKVEELTAEATKLQESIDKLSERVGSPELDELNQELTKLRQINGRTPVVGPGVTVTLNDAPKRILDDSDDGDIARKIVHQQDIQAVANALLAAGAEAITVQGQRIVSTTGIKCVGSSVLLQGIAYPPPYVISAIGDTDRLRNGLDSDRYLQRYRADVKTYELGWDVENDDNLKFPGYDGNLDTAYARPLS